MGNRDFLHPLLQARNAPSTEESDEFEKGLKRRVKTHEELILEYVIDEAFMRCFKTYEIAGRPIKLSYGNNKRLEAC